MRLPQDNPGARHEPSSCVLQRSSSCTLDNTTSANVQSISPTDLHGRHLYLPSHKFPVNGLAPHSLQNLLYFLLLIVHVPLLCRIWMRNLSGFQSTLHPLQYSRLCARALLDSTPSRSSSRRRLKLMEVPGFTLSSLTQLHRRRHNQILLRPW